MAENAILGRSIKETIKAFCGAAGNTKIYELVSEGRLDAYKLDGRTIITEDSIQRLMASLPPAPIRMASANIQSEVNVGEQASQPEPIISQRRGRRRKMPRQKERAAVNSSTVNT